MKNLHTKKWAKTNGLMLIHRKPRVAHKQNKISELKKTKSKWAKSGIKKKGT